MSKSARRYKLDRQWLRCHVCGFYFKTASQLQKHMGLLVEHKTESTEQLSLPFERRVRQ